MVAVAESKIEDVQRKTSITLDQIFSCLNLQSELGLNEAVARLDSSQYYHLSKDWSSKLAAVRVLCGLTAYITEQYIIMNAPTSVTFKVTKPKYMVSQNPQKTGRICKVS